MGGKTLDAYFSQYEQEHTKPLTRLTHVIGIPMIVASVALAGCRPRVAAGLFAGGWALQLLGHKIEGNRPAFLRDPVYALVGPLWVAREVLEGVDQVVRDVVAALEGGRSR